MYEGEYFEGKKHGHGILRFGDGSKYDGDFQYNDIHCKGTYTWPDGKEYNGEWKYNKQDGQGKFTKNGITRFGLWKNGERI